MRLEGRIAIVTGAARGIGRASAERFAQEGARVMLADINAEAGEATAQALRDDGLDVRFSACDVGSAAEIRDTIAATEAAFGTPDILLNNAAIYRSIDFLEMTQDQFNEVLQVNLGSCFLFSQAVARGLVAKGKTGSIVNISSINARMSSGMATAYSASKGGISAFTAAAALYLADHGIRINAVAPGTIATELAASIKDQPQVLADTLGRIPLRRLGDPPEIAALACFLASDDASYITGQTIFADGGRTALSIVMPKKDAEAT